MTDALTILSLTLTDAVSSKAAITTKIESLTAVQGRPPGTTLRAGPLIWHSGLRRNWLKISRELESAQQSLERARDEYLCAAYAAAERVVTSKLNDVPISLPIRRPVERITVWTASGDGK